MNLLKSTLSAIVFVPSPCRDTRSRKASLTFGIAMPTKSPPPQEKKKNSARWIDDGKNIFKVLRNAVTTLDLQSAEDDIPNQALAQIETSGTRRPRCWSSHRSRHTLVRCAQACQGQGHHRDRLRPSDPDTPNVDFYATSTTSVGVLQAPQSSRVKLKEGRVLSSSSCFRRLTATQPPYFF